VWVGFAHGLAKGERDLQLRGATGDAMEEGEVAEDIREGRVRTVFVAWRGLDQVGEVGFECGSGTLA
jgi:hypothetical protein